MVKFKKVMILVVVVLWAALCFAFGEEIAKAEIEQEKNSVVIASDEEISTRGIYTNLEFALDGNNGQVWASVKNKFTLFPATVYVKIELYRSETFQDKYFNMELVATNYIDDLDQGKIITAAAPTNGKQGYWKARFYYKIDKKDAQEKLSDTVSFNADGIQMF